MIWLKNKISAEHLLKTGQVMFGAYGAFCSQYHSVQEDDPCFSCKTYGHKQGSCKKPTKCGICSERHQTRGCNNKEKPKCPACNGPHPIFDKQCIRHIPFRTATNKKFRALIDEVLPGASGLLIKSHSTVAKHVKKEHDFYQEQLKGLLATSRLLIHFTCDAWTANYGSHELLSITARFIASDGKLSKALLALHKLQSGHAGVQCALSSSTLLSTTASSRKLDTSLLTTLPVTTP